MSAEELLKAGQIEEALKTLQDAVRKSPAEPRLRVFLFQLLCILGRWEKAHNQLQVLNEMDADSILLAQIYRPLLQSEVVRQQVFAGARSALIFGEPEEWIGWLVHANELAIRGQYKGAAELRDKAFEAAPASPGTLNGHGFEWIADADHRFGPVLEAILEGGYYWIPFARISSVRVSAPEDLRNLVWLPAEFVWTNGGRASGFIPSRYPGSESQADSSLQLGRRTDWVENDGGYVVGLGQRMLATDQAETALFDVREVSVAAPAPAA